MGLLYDIEQGDVWGADEGGSEWEKDAHEPSHKLLWTEAAEWSQSTAENV